MSLNTAFTTELDSRIEQLKTDRVYKQLNYLESPQSARVQMEGRGEVLILSSNNYLGLCDEPSVSRRAFADSGASGREPPACGSSAERSRSIEAEEAIARFVGTESSLVRCGVERERGADVDDSPGRRLRRLGRTEPRVDHRLDPAREVDRRMHERRVQHGDLDDLVSKLEQAKGAKRRLIWTDGVFSMEGAIAKLPVLIDIARTCNAVLAVDDSHATGVLGETGRGTAEHFGLLGEVDIITSTLGKALGGAAGGFVAGSAGLCDMLTQRSRPQLFSNALPPTVAASSLAAIEFVEKHPGRVAILRENTRYFRYAITEVGFKPLAGETPIVPIIVCETALAIQMSNMMLDEGCS
jgi:glycine C-acetyltransferase